MTTTVRFSLAAISVLVLATPRTSNASLPYPEELRAALGLSYTPGCTLCHAGVSGNDAGLVNTPFGTSMVARGLRGASASELDAGFSPDGGMLDPTLVAALARMRADGVDSDHDGAEDLDELAWGADPNVYDGLKPNPNQPVSYGCAVSHRRLPSTCSGVIAGLILLVLGGARTKGRALRG